jgi:arsenate reductase
MKLRDDMSQPIKVYHYPKCSTCKKALAYLREHGIAVEAVDISKFPPSKEELAEMVARRGGVRSLFNTSGQSYREGGFSEKISTMSVDQAIEELSRDGMLIKRPFVLTSTHGLVGFKPEQWAVLTR